MIWEKKKKKNSDAVFKIATHEVELGIETNVHNIVEVWCIPVNFKPVTIWESSSYGKQK